MANGLAWGTAAKIAAREMRHSRGKFLFVVLSVAIGVAALTGVRGFSASFRATLLDRRAVDHGGGPGGQVDPADDARGDEGAGGDSRVRRADDDGDGDDVDGVVSAVDDAGTGELEGGRSGAVSVLWGDNAGAGDAAEGLRWGRVRWRWATTCCCGWGCMWATTCAWAERRFALRRRWWMSRTGCRETSKRGRGC